MTKENDFRSELSSLLNRHNMEQLSNTPDFLLAEFLTGCLDAFDSATRKRAQWYAKGKMFSELPAGTRFWHTGQDFVKMSSLSSQDDSVALRCEDGVICPFAPTVIVDRYEKPDE